MRFKRALRFLFGGVLRFFRTLTALGWSLLSKLRLRYNVTRQINMSDDECEFDSTWEDGDENKTPRKKKFHIHGGSRRNMFAARDMQAFRHSCRGLDENSDDDDDGAGEQYKGHLYNLDFYRGKLRSSPDELFIDDFHQWLGEYDLLEDVHSYIQWLFPIQEPGVNWRAHVLSKKEIKLFRKDKEVKTKLVQSYKLMLDFYGICLKDVSTGEVARASNWKDRFKNLNRHTHNNLRITRILKCLGTLGLKHYQAPLVKFFLNETLVRGELQNVKHSVLDYFMFAVLDKSERRDLVKFAFERFKPQEHFVWGPKKILSGQVAHCNNENMDQPTENNSSSAEDQQKRVNIKHEIEKKEANRPPKERQSKKDHQNKDEPVITTPEHEGVVKKKKNQDLTVGVSDDNENIAPANKSHGHGAVSGSHQTEEKSKNDHQNNDEPVFQNKMTETNSDKWENKSRQCSSENGDEVKQNHETGVGDGVGDGDGDGVSDNNENIAPANKSHGHDAFGGSHQTKEGSSCQVPDVEIKDETEDKESEDNQKISNLHESEHEIEKKEASHSPQEMKCRKDHQNENEPVISNQMTEANSVSVSDDNENTAPANMSHDHDAASGSHQTKEGSSRQERDVEMELETEDNQKRLNPHESEHEASRSPEETKSKKEGTSCQVCDVEMKDETKNKHEKSENEQ
uniref:Opioid growth factor receptor (OGFr) conserved domain-containing protein n=2 Tax=Cyprinus carpio TaxID=7962 RepID=A0A8C1YUA0_CYPCA